MSAKGVGDGSKSVECVDKASEFNVKCDGTLGCRGMSHCLFVSEFFFLDKRWGQVEISIIDQGKVACSKKGFGQEMISGMVWSACESVTRLVVGDNWGNRNFLQSFGSNSCPI